MRFASKSPRLGLGTVVREKFVLALDGQRDQVAESVFVQFSQEHLTQADVDAALAHFKSGDFKGMSVEGDGITPYPPLTERIGVFDTDIEADKYGWDAATKEKVEKYLLNHPEHNSSFVKVEKQHAAKPWNTYDQTHHNKIPVLAAELGAIDEALAYERENKNRESVLAALEAAKPKAETVDGELIVA